MKNFLVSLCAAALISGVVGSAQALPINGGFETGNLTAWNYAGDVSVDTSFTIGGTVYNPTEGNYLAKLGSTAASGVWFDDLLIMDSFDVIMTPYSSFSAWVLAVTGDGTENEFTFNVYNDSADSPTLDLSFLTFNVPEDWCVTIYGVGVDLGNTIFVDNVSGRPCPGTTPVPEPSTMLLLGSGLLGLLGFRRKLKN